MVSKMNYTLNDLTIKAMKVTYTVCKNYDLPEASLKKLENKLATGLTFEVEVENYPIVILGAHVLVCNFTLHGMEWCDDGYYGCSLVAPEKFWEYITISTPDNCYVDLHDVDHWLSAEIVNKLLDVVKGESLNHRVYDRLSDELNVHERTLRGFI